MQSDLWHTCSMTASSQREDTKTSHGSRILQRNCQLGQLGGSHSMDQQVIQSPHVRAAARFWARITHTDTQSGSRTIHSTCCRVSAAIESVDSRSEAPSGRWDQEMHDGSSYQCFPCPIAKVGAQGSYWPTYQEQVREETLSCSNKVSPQVPAELQCLHLKTKDNKPLCWHRNLQKGCSNQVKKGRCKFGYHFCMKCLKPGHGAFECKNWLGSNSPSKDQFSRIAEPEESSGISNCLRCFAQAPFFLGGRYKWAQSSFAISTRHRRETF